MGLNVGHVLNVGGQPRKALVVPGPIAKGKKSRLIGRQSLFDRNHSGSE